jgi:hypothetical protein
MSVEAMKQTVNMLVTLTSVVGDADKAIDTLCKAIERAEKPGWVGLTDEDIYATAKEVGHSYFSIARAIEAKLKEKNYD